MGKTESQLKDMPQQRAKERWLVEMLGPIIKHYLDLEVKSTCCNFAFEGYSSSVPGRVRPLLWGEYESS